MDEYEQVQRLRELWTRSIMTWGQVFLPLGAAIVAFFVTQSRTSTGDWDLQLLGIGWILFSICMVYWRWVVHRIDEQIVGLYPSMLRLDKEKKWETQTEYYYNNLASRSLSFLCERLSLEDKLGAYEDFKEVAKGRGKDHYDLLLEVWRKYHRNSVGDRGHKIQDKIVLAVVVGLLAAVLCLKIGAWALLAFFLYLVIIPWGRHHGWWFVKSDP